jgi:enoyl-CoA hydratase/carnithine racemase
MSVTLDHPQKYIALITIDKQEKFNAMSREMMAELVAIWDELETSDCRAIVLTGAGEKAFTAGADVSGDLSASEEMAHMINRSLLKTSSYPKPIIAAVNGICAGGGVELMLASDIRFSAPHARFGLPEVKWGIYPFGGTTSKLIQQIGYVHAMKMILTAEMLDAREATRISLINEVVPADELLDTAFGCAEKIAANSPVAVQNVKEHITEGLAKAALTRENAEQKRGDIVRESADFSEGVAAFREKRKPKY